MRDERADLPLLTESEAAERLGVGKKTLYRWRKEGLVPFVDLPGRLVRYRSRDLDQFARSRRRRDG